MFFDQMWKNIIYDRKMAGYEYEDETEKVTWSIVNDIKQVTEDIISSIIGSIQQVSI